MSSNCPCFFPCVKKLCNIRLWILLWRTAKRWNTLTLNVSATYHYRCWYPLLSSPNFTVLLSSTIMIPSPFVQVNAASVREDAISDWRLRRSATSWQLGKGLRCSNPMMVQMPPVSKKSVGKALQTYREEFTSVNCSPQHRAPGVYKARIFLEADVYFTKQMIVWVIRLYHISTLEHLCSLLILNLVAYFL